MSDTPLAGAGAVDAEALAADVRRALDRALAERGLDVATPEVRAAVFEALAARPADRKFTAAQKRVYALELRIAGGTYREIAPLVGYASPGACHKAVMKALEGLEREPAEALRQIAVERLEGILAGKLYREAKKGDLKSIDRVIKVMRETRRYIPGLEVPVNAELTGAGGGAIIVELNLPDAVPVTPVPQGELGGLVLDLPSEEVPVDEDDE